MFTKSHSWYSHEKSFVMLRITHAFAPQTYLKPLDFFRFTKNHSYHCVILMCLLRKLTLQFIAALPRKRCISTKITSCFSPLFSIERRWSSRTFRYGYLVTTSPQSLASPSAAPSLRLGHRLRVLPTPMVWRAVCTRPGNVFTATFWFAITSDSSFM